MTTAFAENHINLQENSDKPMNEYSTQTQQDIINQQTISLRGNLRKERDQLNQSLISSATDQSTMMEAQNGGDKNTLHLSAHKNIERERNSPTNMPINSNLNASIHMNIDSARHLAAIQNQSNNNQVMGRLQNQMLMQQS